MERRLAWGAALWLLRPAYVALELVVAAATTGDYRLTRDTVSDLGALTCDPRFCSPWHDLMNATFVGTGLLLGAGAVLLAPRLGRVVTVLLVVAGTSSAAVGLAPVDQHPGLHFLAAAPLFVAQPLALCLLGVRLRREHPRIAGAVLATGVVTAVAALGFVLGAPGAGVLERVALWPVIFALAAVGSRGARASTGPARPGPAGVRGTMGS
ncbi:DUF998 domain-containing protein [Nocardioides aurantiacus]|uniref:DUF998 domain-containing protein n=1 Tax=Nocardioides aurantiacus TaxID=86796 RepID=UPI001476F7AF|nr:DUF998 domain-containing protein [Nocardioides aurantiacus]